MPRDASNGYGWNAIGPPLKRSARRSRGLSYLCKTCLRRETSRRGHRPRSGQQIRSIKDIAFPGTHHATGLRNYCRNLCVTHSSSGEATDAHPRTLGDFGFVTRKPVVSRRAPFTLVVLTCMTSSTSGADQLIDERARAAVLAHPIEESRLAEVRGGSGVSAGSLMQLGVILWDELRLPPVPPVPPVRNTVSDVRLSTEMNTPQK